MLLYLIGGITINYAKSGITDDENEIGGNMKSNEVVFVFRLSPAYTVRYNREDFLRLSARPQAHLAYDSYFSRRTF